MQPSAKPQRLVKGARKGWERKKENEWKYAGRK